MVMVIKSACCQNTQKKKCFCADFEHVDSSGPQTTLYVCKLIARPILRLVAMIFVVAALVSVLVIVKYFTSMEMTQCIYFWMMKVLRNTNPNKTWFCWTIYILLDDKIPLVLAYLVKATNICEQNRNSDFTIVS